MRGSLPIDHRMPEIASSDSNPSPWRKLARVRVPLGFAAGAVVLWLADPTRQSLAWGAPVAALGEAIRIWAAGHLEKGSEVTSSGPYRLTRHPLYVGSTTIGLGLAVACRSVPVAVVIALYLGIMVTAAIKAEESHLRWKFGGEYDAYSAGRRANRERRFSLDRAIKNREYRTLVGLLVAIQLLALKIG